MSRRPDVAQKSSGYPGDNRQGDVKVNICYGIQGSLLVLSVFSQINLLQLSICMRKRDAFYLSGKFTFIKFMKNIVSAGCAPLLPTGWKSSSPVPARSPGLTPLDFFIWGYFKRKANDLRPGTLGGQKSRIQAGSESIPKSMPKGVQEHMVRGIRIRLAKNSVVFENFLQWKMQCKLGSENDEPFFLKTNRSRLLRLLLCHFPYFSV